MVGALFDTNILIDLVRGHQAARSELLRWRRAHISVVTRIEFLAGPPEDADIIRDLLSGMQVVPIDSPIVEAAAVIRRDTRLKLPDAVILATAQVLGLPLLTRNTKDFEGREGVVIPYRL